MQEVGRGPIIAAGALLGMGLGGLADGIVFHQLLQTHSMLSAKIERTTVVGLETNMFWDGVFHVSVWAMVVLGLAVLWRAVHGKHVSVPTRILVGGLALGWGCSIWSKGSSITTSWNSIMWLRVPIRPTSTGAFSHQAQA
jgi:uncharacterized membrane protein